MVLVEESGVKLLGAFIDGVRNAKPPNLLSPNPKPHIPIADYTPKPPICQTL
jgi:hypothetical protein